ncbi:MAG: DUF3422 domain-containing protein [Hyphomicrobiales bacterium]|nr:DUF3422 domain-containing protein [Hyphomicrobiales bacterium]
MNQTSADLFEPHELRAAALAEIHARPFSHVDTPGRILHFVFMSDAAGGARAAAALADMARARGLPAPGPEAKHVELDLAPARLSFERHGEFLTYTWAFVGSDKPFQPAAGDLLSAMRLVPQPGPLLAAVDLHILHDTADVALDDFFAGLAIAAADVDDGRARIASDFTADAFGFVRILIADRTLSPASAGALAQRLIEIETYRMLALLGLPMAQRLVPVVRRIESELPALLLSMKNESGLEANRALLEKLTALATELETGSAESHFRFGATRAYAELVRARLDAIKEKRIPHHSTFSSFLARRLNPAIRTCANIEERQNELGRKIARIAELLRTRVDVELESQNADQIRQMAERVRLQLRLQQTVEGLSVAAITYYISSVLHLLFEGMHGAGFHVNPAVATGLSVPFVLALVGYTVWRIRHAHKDE